MNWRVVYVKQGYYLSLNIGRLEIKVASEKDQPFFIPLSDINMIIVDNYSATLTVSLISTLAKRNIALVFCSVDQHLPTGVLIPFHGLKKSLPVIKKQIAWSKRIKNKIHSFLIKNKINNQLKLLKKIHKNHINIDKLKLYYSQVKAADKTKREAVSAQIYFKSLFGKSFVRETHPGETTVNICLNFGYAILRSEISKILVGKGLNTSLAFFHRGQDNEFNLSDDFIEPFRSLVDHLVYNNFLEETRFLPTFKHIIVEKITNTFLLFQNKKHTLFNGITLFVQQVLDFCDTKTQEEMKLQEIQILYEKS